MTPRKKSSSDVSDITKKVVKTTPKGKEYIIDQNTHGYFFVKFSTGGQIPKALAGRYTRYEFAQEAIAIYLAEK